MPILDGRLYVLGAGLYNPSLFLPLSLLPIENAGAVADGG